MPSTPYPNWSAATLRHHLHTHARDYITTHPHPLLHDHTTGTSPSILFGCDDDTNTHGNFHPASYAAILANPDWARRLTKVHTAHRRHRARADWHWRELDCANSSDALLMNIFCHPQVFNGTTLAPAVARLLNIDPQTQPHFGIHPGVPLLGQTTRPTKTRPPKTRPTNTRSTDKLADNPAAFPENEKRDRTEIDLQLGPLFLEAKLTETGFQSASPIKLLRYRDLETVFDLTRLPRLQSTPKPSPHAHVEADYNQEIPAQDLQDQQTSHLTPIPQNHFTSYRTQSLSTPFRTQPNSTPYRTQPNPTPTAPQPTPTAPQPSPTPNAPYLAYQLIRNVLAAYAANAAFCLLCDARRHDLIETWYKVLTAIHRPTFTPRLKLLTWQELTPTLPPDLQTFLTTKYDITDLPELRPPRQNRKGDNKLDAQASGGYPLE